MQRMNYLQKYKKHDGHTTMTDPAELCVQSVRTRYGPYQTIIANAV